MNNNSMDEVNRMLSRIIERVPYSVEILNAVMNFFIENDHLLKGFRRISLKDTDDDRIEYIYEFEGKFYKMLFDLKSYGGEYDFSCMHVQEVFPKEKKVYYYE